MTNFEGESGVLGRLGSASRLDVRLRWGVVLSRMLLTSLLLPFGLASCVTAPPAEDYFDKRTPENVVDAFRYAIETGQRSFAFHCLTEESRKDLSPSHFILLGWREEEGVSYRDLIVRGQRGAREPVGADRGTVYTYFDGENDEGVLTYIPLEVHVERDRASGLWFIEILTTLGIN